MRNLVIASTLILFTLKVSNVNAIDIVLNNNSANSYEQLINFQKKALVNGDKGIKGKLIIGTGIGLNLICANLLVKYNKSFSHINDNSNSYNYYSGSYYDTAKLSMQNITSKPMINVSVDYGIAKSVSVGVGFGYQTATANWSYTSNRITMVILVIHQFSIIMMIPGNVMFIW